MLIAPTGSRFIFAFCGQFVPRFGFRFVKPHGFDVGIFGRGVGKNEN